MAGCPVLMLWTAPTTGIAMCPIAVTVAERRESAYGYELPWAGIVNTKPSQHDLHALIGNGSCLAYGGNLPKAVIQCRWTESPTNRKLWPEPRSDGGR